MRSTIVKIIQLTKRFEVQLLPIYRLCFVALNKKGQYGAYALQKGFTISVRNAKEDNVYPSKSIY